MKTLLLLIILLSTFTSQAQDRLFTYTYQSNVLNRGQKEIEVWTTLRNTRDRFYRALDHKLEFEVGLGSKIQTAFYLIYGYSKGISELNGTETLIPGSGYGFANEWKIKLTDPVVNPMGTALYFEYVIGTDEVELESKLIFDKQSGNFIQALNLVGEYEFKTEFEQNGSKIETFWEHELKLNADYGFTYKVNKNLALGFETVIKNMFESGVLKYSVFSAGPALSYNMEGFWVNLGFLPQLVDFTSGKLELTKNEKFQARLIFSYVI